MLLPESEEPPLRGGAKGRILGAYHAEAVRGLWPDHLHQLLLAAELDAVDDRHAVAHLQDTITLTLRVKARVRVRVQGSGSGIRVKVQGRIRVRVRARVG